MVGGNTRVNRDLPPYFLYSGFNAEPEGLNLTGLRRAGVSAQEIGSLKRAYRMLYRTGLKLEDALARINSELQSEHALHLAHFIKQSKRGIARERAGRRNE